MPNFFVQFYLNTQSFSDDFIQNKIFALNNFIQKLFITHKMNYLNDGNLNDDYFDDSELIQWKWYELKKYLWSLIENTLAEINF